MSLLDDITSLNKIIKSASLNNRCEIQCDDYNVGLSSAIKNLAPYSRCAFVCNEKTHNDFFDRISKVVKDNGGSLISFIKQNEDLSVDSACELFNLPEDVRAVIVMDNGLFDVCSYYATIKGISVIIIPKSVDLTDLINPVLYIKNGNIIDRVVITAKRCIIIDENLIDEGDMASAYSCIMSQLSTFSDYRINGLVWGKALNKTAYDLARKAVTSEYSLFNQPKNSRVDFTLVNGLRLQVANFISHGELFFSSGSYVVGKFLGKEAMLYASKCLLGIYDTCINYDYSQLLSIPDYYGRALAVSNYLNSNVEQIIEETNKELKVLRPSLIRANVVLKNLWAEINSLNKLTSTIQNTYQALGGKNLTKEEKSKILSAVRFCGDTFYGINVMTVLRENGITDTEYFL